MPSYILVTWHMGVADCSIAFPIITFGKVFALSQAVPYPHRQH